MSVQLLSLVARIPDNPFAVTVGKTSARGL